MHWYRGEEVMDQEYILLFKPFRPTDTDPNDPAVLMPILVHDDGRQIAITKVVTDVEKALSLHAGFELAQWVEGLGGFDAVMEVIEERKTEKDDGVHSSEA
jgi:hypothetical protein